MFLNGAGFLLVVIVLALVLFSLKALIGRDWFRAWMKGNLAIAGVLFAMLVLFGMWDVSAYTPYAHDALVAEVSIQKTADQKFLVRVRNESMVVEYPLSGDMWQLDTRMIVWSGLLEILGMKPAFRLDRLSGRYFTLEQETRSERSVYSLEGSSAPLDIWELTTGHDWLPWIQARQGVGVYMPLVDGAEFLVQMRSKGLEVSPANDVAKKAMFSWK